MSSVFSLHAIFFICPNLLYAISNYLPLCYTIKAAEPPAERR
nr:MAG TPA: hypothetical protein [Caudoviricetes sp.]